MHHLSGVIEGGLIEKSGSVIMIVEETTHKVEAVVHKKKEKRKKREGLLAYFLK